MPKIKHLGYGSLAIELTDGSATVLGPRDIQDIPVDQFDSESIQRALNDGSIVVLPSEAQAEKKAKPKPNSN